MHGRSIPLKVLTFNIRYGTADDGPNDWRHRRESVLDFLATSPCEIICLQEVLHSQLVEIQRAAPHLHSVGVGRDDGHAEGEYAPILYDSRRIHLVDSGTFWLSEKPALVASTSWGNSIPRICTHAVFQTEQHPFEVYNAHLDHESAQSRFKSVELIADKIQTGFHSAPALITGDFNETEDGPAVRQLMKRGFGDTYRIANPDGEPLASYNGWQNVQSGEKIDYIFASDAWSVLESTVMNSNSYGRLLSDHYPVFASLALPG